MKRFLIFTACSIMAFACVDKNDLANPAEDRSTLKDWTDASHGKLDTPNYAEVFAQERVNVLEINLGAALWDSVMVDMKARTKIDFGGRKTQTPGAPAVGGGGGGGNPGDLVPGDPKFVPVSLKYNGKEWYNVGFRLKGNSSLSTAWGQGIYKLPFKLQFDEFEDKFPNIKDQRFFGFKEFSMSPAHNDASLMRDKIASDIFREGGIPAARTAFCAIYINFGQGLQYCGVYTMVEVIDDSMVKDQFGDEKGNIYKPESDFRSFAVGKFEKKSNETTADYTDVQNFITALNASNRLTEPEKWRQNLENTFNVDHYLKCLAINNTIVNWDTYGAIAHNYYLYTPTQTKKVTWIPWDFNLSMSAINPPLGGGGQPAGGGGIGRAVSLSLSEVGTNWPLINFIAKDQTYFAKYKTYVKAFAETIFTKEKMNARIDREAALIAPWATKEQAPYSFLTNNAAHATALTALKTHVVNRKVDVDKF
jgi:spore coat protein H